MEDRLNIRLKGLEIQESKPMERPKLTAIVTGAISLVLGILYLLGVQILDAREMVPAPIGLLIPHLW